MVQTLEAIKGGGGSVRVGTVGTIGSLMTRELEAFNPASRASSSSRLASGSQGNGSFKPRSSKSEATRTDMSTSIKHRSSESQQRTPATSITTSKRLKQKAPLEDVGNSTATKGTTRSDIPGKTRIHKRSYQIPMLNAENIHLEKTPIREKPMRRVSHLVDIVDINCGAPAGTLSNRLKKLSFSKLSHSFM